MATTIVNSTFTTTVTDGITLNGKTYGNTNTKAIGSCNEAYERVLTIPAASATQCFIPILSATPTPDSGGDITFEEFEYARFTNLDSEYPIWLKFTNTAGIFTNPATSTQTFCVKLDAGMSYIMPSSQYLADDADIDCSAIISEGGKRSLSIPTSWTVHAVSHTTDCDLEMFVVTK